MVRTIRLGGTASDVDVASIGHGLMLMTWTPNPVTDDQAFQAIKDGVDAAGGAKVLLNSGEFYGQGSSTANLELLARFYMKYPEYVNKTVLCVKGGLMGMAPVSSEENLRRSIDNINAKLQGTKRVDIFESARVDPTRPIEETMQNMKKLIHEGKFDHVGLSECSAQTLRRAHAVYPVASVEIEVSPWSYEEETKKVIATAAELQVTVQAYSPLGHGFLTGQLKKFEDLPEGDGRRNLDRFKPENWDHNIKFVDRLKIIAHKRGVSPGQLCIAWVSSLGPHVLPIPGSSKSTRTLENLAAGEIQLEDEDRAEIDKLLGEIEVKGGRYHENTSRLWG